MTTLKIFTVNVETGVEELREFNAEELAQQVKDEAAAKAETATQLAQNAAKETAQAKLTALGLTVDDLKALGLQAEAANVDKL